MTPDDDQIVLENVSKFYGEVLGVNRVSLAIPPGITSLVGPNGAGKSTLLNLMTGLLRTTQGRLRILGISPDEPEAFYRKIGYCTQFDAFPKGLSGYDFLFGFLMVHGYPPGEADAMVWRALEKVNLVDAARRRVTGYSKGMRQRIKLAQAFSHEPPVLVLDEPLNGLDPMARAEVIALFRDWANEGRHVIISSHILHEVDLISDRVILLSNGYVVAEGDIQGVRDEIEDRPMQILVRCDKPSLLASRVFQQDHVVEARVLEDGRGLLISTRNQEQFYLMLNRVVLECDLAVEAVAPADDNVDSVYHYLIGSSGSGP